VERCPKFEACDAPLCPLDPDVALRIWYADEDICSSRHSTGVRWIRKQRSIVRHQTRTWLGRIVRHQELVEASRPRALSEAQRAQLAERLKRARQQKKTH